MSVEDKIELLTPTEFVQPNYRLFIDTNIFMDTNQKWTGGLKQLFDRVGGDVVRHENPVVIPREVVGELRKFAGANPYVMDRAGLGAEDIDRVRNVLTFLESAESHGLVRTDLGDDSTTRAYADPSFMKAIDIALARGYGLCAVTDDYTVQVRIRLRAITAARRLVAGPLTSEGMIAVYSDQELYDRASTKLYWINRRIADGTAKPKDVRESAELETLLPEFQTALGLRAGGRSRQADATRVPKTSTARGVSLSELTRDSGPRPFSKSPRFRGADQALPRTRITGEGEQITFSAGADGGTITLGKMIGEGGEGRVFEVVGVPGQVAKLFDPEHRTVHRQKKLDLLVSRELVSEGISFPTATLALTGGEFLGYMMPLASGRELQRTVTNPARFKKSYPTWTKADLVDVCISFLEKVTYLHALNILLGDINPKNVMVDAQKNVWIIDADSWQFEGYPCPVGTPMFTASTVKGEYASRLRTMQEENFAVATMLFNILMTGQYPYVRSGADTGDAAALILDGKFPYQFQGISDQDQPDGNWKFMWSHLPFPVKSLFWNTFHRDGKRYKRRPGAEEWLQVFRDYQAFFGSADDFDPMSSDVYPFRLRAFRPDTPILDCPGCGRANAIVGKWDDDDKTYFVHALCFDCNQQRPGRSPAGAAAQGGSSCPGCGKQKKDSELIYSGQCWDCYREEQRRQRDQARVSARPARSAPQVSARRATTASTPQTATCKSCHRSVAKSTMTYGRCPDCTTKAKQLDPARLCVDCRQPFITFDHIDWFKGKGLDIPRSHVAIKQACSPKATVPTKTRTSARTTTKPSTPAKKSLWTRFVEWLKS